MVTFGVTLKGFVENVRIIKEDCQIIEMCIKKQISEICLPTCI